MEAFEFLGFGLHAWITIVTVLSMFTVLLFTKLRADLVFLGAIGILFVTHNAHSHKDEGKIKKLFHVYYVISVSVPVFGQLNSLRQNTIYSTYSKLMKNVTKVSLSGKITYKSV